MYLTISRTISADDLGNETALDIHSIIGTDINTLNGRFSVSICAGSRPKDGKQGLRRQGVSRTSFCRQDIKISHPYIQVAEELLLELPSSLEFVAGEEPV